MFKLIFISIISLLLTASPAYAYIGPGMGGGIVAATLGVLVAIFAALFGILYLPFKRFLKNRKKKKADDQN
jgi:membrane protein implicated in regulation of membrane protease activity